MINPATLPMSQKYERKRFETHGALSVYLADPSGADIQWRRLTPGFHGALGSIRFPANVASNLNWARNFGEIAVPAVSADTFDSDFCFFLAPNQVHQLEIKRQDFKRWNRTAFNTFQAIALGAVRQVECNAVNQVAPATMVQVPDTVITTVQLPDTTVWQSSTNSRFFVRIFDDDSWWERAAFEELTTWIANRRSVTNPHEDYIGWSDIIDKAAALSRRDRLSIWGDIVRDLLDSAVQPSPQSIEERITKTLLQRLARIRSDCRHHPYDRRSYRCRARTIRQRVLAFDLMTGVSPPEMTSIPLCRRPSHFQCKGEHRAQLFRTLREGALPNGEAQGHLRCGGASRAIRIRLARQGKVAYRRHRVFQKLAAHESEGRRSAAVYGSYPGWLLDHISVGR